ncbi:beta-lactamase family protein [Deefgea tanakiae]|uniref:Beta-lactamase family protein n=1 Tax=Deefgea tanakiae TaxID=2865840 RepID=A0ABX8Z6Y5_9NEIS|nr:serine hydrolase domain-containing protein [Deefgea tanakiae]QZA77555.1 beta-lactamase family protein [Deefgea tanakiae]
MHPLLRQHQLGFFTSSRSAYPAMDDGPMQAAVVDHAQLQTQVEQFRHQHHLPGVGVVLVQNDTILSACSGQRRIDAPAFIQNSDSFPLGALSKAVTATLVARWVEQGKLRWDSTLADLLPAWRDQMRTEFQSVTVLQLLQHRAGLARGFGDLKYSNLLAMLGGNPSANRSTAARWILQQAYIGEVNQRTHYSNIGYFIVAIIIELLGSNTYENILQQQLFSELSLHPHLSNTSSVQGHQSLKTNWFSKPRWHKVNKEERQDLARLNPTVRLSQSEYGIFLREHLRGLRGQSTLLSPASFQQLHTPIDHYALGWSIIRSAEFGPLSVHDSTEDGYTHYTLLMPSQNRAIAILCNAESACSDAKLVKFAESLLTSSMIKIE